MNIEILEQFFDGDEHFLTTIDKRHIVEKFQAGSMIITQGDHDSDVFLLLEGKVKATVLSAEGHEIWLGDFGPGDLFGEMAAIGNMVRTSNIEAVSDCSIAVFKSNNFIALMKKSGTLSTKISEILVKRIHSTTRRMFELSALSAPGRIYAEILRLSVPFNDKDTEIRIIEPVPAAADLARRVNSTRETASRAINRLEKIGLIIREENQMKIITPSKLGDLIC